MKDILDIKDQGFNNRLIVRMHDEVAPDSVFEPGIALYLIKRDDSRSLGFDFTKPEQIDELITSLQQAKRTWQKTVAERREKTRKGD